MKFDQHFQKCFAAHLLREGSFVESVRRDVTAEHFADENLRRLMRLVLTFFDEHKSSPGALVFQELDSWRSRQLISEEQYKICATLADDLFKVQLENRSYLLQEFERYIRHQMFVSKAPEITEAFQRGEIDRAEKCFKEVFSFRRNQGVNLGREFSGDPSERIHRRTHQDDNRLWTLIPELDREVDGISTGEIAIWQSQESSGGKSAALAYLARSVLMQKKRCLLFTLEMTEEQYEDRLDQTIVGLRKAELKSASEIQNRVSWLLRFGGGLRIVHLPAYLTKVSDLRRAAELIRQIHNFIPDVVLIDYADLLGPEDDRLRGDLYAIGADVFSHLLGWMQADGLRCWTACQSGRKAPEQGYATPSDIAGSLAKIQIAQIVVSINRTPAEAAAGETRLYVGKNRDGRAKFEIPIKSDFSRMQFFKTTTE